MTTIIYADYSYGLHRAEETIDAFTQRMGCRPDHPCQHAFPGHFGYTAVEQFSPKFDRKDATNRSGRPIGVWTRFIEPLTERPVTFVYLITEAIQSYLNLWAIHHSAPFIVVVQNHGKGGLWTPLDGDCLLFAASLRLPEYLYVGDIGSSAWPHYKQISRKVCDQFSMHGSHRALFQCTQPLHFNPKSPLLEWNGKSPSMHSQAYPDFHRLNLLKPDSV